MIADLLTAFVTDRVAEFQASERSSQAERIADAAEREMQRVYLEWLAESAPQLEAEPDERRRDELLLLLLLLLSGRVRRVLEKRMLQVGTMLDATSTEIAAMRNQLEQTATIFEQRTVPRLRDSLRVAITLRLTMENAPAVIDELAGEASRVGLAGGIIWTIYQAAKQERAGMVNGGILEARWTGPDDKVTCPPCSEQMRLGWRPHQTVPMPGPSVCLGLTSCRHDIIYRNPISEKESTNPEDLAI